MKQVTYLIDGNLENTGWVTYGLLGAVTATRAVEVLNHWQGTRNASDFEVRYRLVRRTVEDEVILSEESEWT